jgi:ATP-binding cassette subfamily B protein
VTKGRRTAPILRDVLRTDPRLAATVVAMRLAAAVLTPLDAVALGLLVDAGLRGDVRAAVGWAALLALADVGSSAFNHPAGKLEMTLREKTNFAFERRLLRVSTAPHTLDHLERPEFHDRIEQARDRASALGDVLVRAIALLQAAVLMGVVLFALVSVHWVLVALVAAAVPAIYLGGRGEVVRVRGDERAAPSLRLADRLFALAAKAGPAKEIKVNRAEGFVRDRFGAASRRAYRALDAAEGRALAFTVAGWLAFSVIFVLAMAFVVREAVGGRATPGQVLLVLALAIRLTEQVDEFSGAMSGVRRALLDVRRLRWLYDVGDTTPAVPAPRTPAASGPAAGDIELRDVTFRYPGTGTDILRGVSLRLPVGATVALVGENGTGKTTLVKLLCGLYPPTGGAITWAAPTCARSARSGGRRRCPRRFRTSSASSCWYARRSASGGSTGWTTTPRCGTPSTGPVPARSSKGCHTGCGPSSVHSGRTGWTFPSGSGSGLPSRGR